MAAKEALAQSDWTRLEAIIGRAGADISFGYGQQIVLYHYFGDRKATLDNIMSVRERVFGNPLENLVDCAKRMAGNLTRAGGDPNLYRLGNDPWLGALVIYNAGSIPTDPAWWQRWAGNVESYRQTIALAKNWGV